MAVTIGCLNVDIFPNSSCRELCIRQVHRKAQSNFERSIKSEGVPSVKGDAFASELNAFAKLKSQLRKAAARTINDLWSAIAKAIDTYSPTECANYFAAAGYDAI